MGFLIFPILFGVALYFLPTLIGLRKRNAGAIFALNLLLGWTIVGWVIALVWALTKEDVPSAVLVQTVPQVAQGWSCAVCRTPIRPGDGFCRACGTRILAGPAA